MNKKICIYHGNCADGFTAAWVVRKALGDDVEFYAGVYQTSPPDVTAADVYIVDFAYKRPVMEEIISKAASVTHIDHHYTAIIDLQGLEDKMTTLYSLENKYSGAMLTWMFFFPDQEPPQLIKHVDDRDRWKFEIPKTKEIQASIFSYPYTFENWDYLINANMDDLATEGSAIDRKHLKDVRELIGVMKHNMTIGGYNVPVCNLPYTMSSEAGAIMAVGQPFAACYYDKADGVEFSLRSSRDGGIDVSAIAIQYGGGGHFNAAGFRVTYEQFKNLFESNK
jgi:oligoribonuclease NrnB/cAMP/cGMP phosphodiesterase (DHH superfamily)